MGVKDMRSCIVDGNIRHVRFEKLTARNVAKGLTHTTNRHRVRRRDGGVAPTLPVGMQLAAGNGFLYAGALSKIKFIEETTGADLNVSYYA